ncbi:Hypothetical protein FKW44_005112 [Caligus rogercresseyi]|uniref:Uncharacterized protein n=1 Tax=Caligus rogercresseyi TaxID=217165 RepID=A0A7T8KBH4_CALRO|nr:Hypothetical protein FKW44_005112 [Caligus rogercresseyi]
MPLNVGGKSPAPKAVLELIWLCATRRTCYGNPDSRKECKDWHGHIRAAVRIERKREREEDRKK